MFTPQKWFIKNVQNGMRNYQPNLQHFHPPLTINSFTFPSIHHLPSSIHPLIPHVGLRLTERTFSASFHSYIYPSIHPSVFPREHPFIHSLSISPSIHPPFHPPILLPQRQSIIRMLSITHASSDSP